MPGENILDWSTTASNNGTADSSINWAEGMARAAVNDSARSMMAAHAKDRNLKNGSITTGGSANAQTITSGMSFTANPTGMVVRVKNGFTNTATMTLQLDSATALTVKNMYGAALSGREVVAGAYSTYVCDGTNWILVDGYRLWTVTLITATNAAWPVPTGTREMKIEGWGGGGSGGGQADGDKRGGGGGGGGYFFKYYNGAMDATLAITIGAGGAAVTTGATGNTGGNTTVVGANLGTLAANGGFGGGNGLSTGAGGGSASGGDINITGGAGSTGGFTSIYGIGGSSPRGGNGGAESVGAAGIVPGGGGSGENHTGGNSGAGAAGRVLIWTR